MSVGFNVNSFDDNYLNSAELYRLYEWLFFLLFCLPGIFHLYFLFLKKSFLRYNSHTIKLTFKL